MDFMSKVVASLEDYDSILNAPRPNCTSKTWYLNEEYVMNIPKTMGHWNIIDIDTGKLWENNGIPTKDTHFIQSYIDYRFEDKIHGKHLYIINASNPSFFYLNEQIGFSVVKEKYLEDIRKNKSAIVIVQLYEGTISNEELSIVEQWAGDQQIHKSSIHIITGNLSPNLQSEIQTYQISSFESWIDEKFRNDNLICNFNKNYNNIFLSFNRQPRVSRIYLGTSLYQNELLDKGLFSMISFDKSDINLNMPNICESDLDDFISQLPLTIDSDLTENKWYVDSREPYEKAFLSIVTETLTECDRLFITEKTWKPIVVGHPFMIVGNKNTLSYLKSIGYKTFSEFWDESYDEYESWEDRIDCITKNIYELSQKSTNELHDIYEKIKPILIHNKMNFRKLFFNNWDGNTEHIQLKKIIFNIYNNLQD